MTRALNESYWTYRAPSAPHVSELPPGAVAPDTTQAEWQSLSPGMRREIERQALRNKAKES